MKKIFLMTVALIAAPLFGEELLDCDKKDHFDYFDFCINKETEEFLREHESNDNINPDLYIEMFNKKKLEKLNKFKAELLAGMNEPEGGKGMIDELRSLLNCVEKSRERIERRSSKLAGHTVVLEKRAKDLQQQQDEVQIIAEYIKLANEENTRAEESNIGEME